MERVSIESSYEPKLTATDITEDLPRDCEGFVAAPLVIDDNNEKVLQIVSKIVSLIYSGSNFKKIAVKDRDLQDRLMKIISEYLKQLLVHLAIEMRIFGDLEYIVVIVYYSRKIVGIGVVTRTDAAMREEYNDEEAQGVVVLITNDRLSVSDVRRILEIAQRKAEAYASRLGLAVPDFSSTDVNMVKILMIGVEEQDVIKIRIKEDYAKPCILRIPVVKPAWFLDDLPFQLREEMETIVIEPHRINAKFAPRGMIIVGPPGVGKSVAAEAIAHAMNKNLVRIVPSVYRSMWYGMTEKTLHKIFSAMKSRRDLVVLVDDADFLVQRMQAIHEAYIAEVNVWLNILQDPSRPFVIMTTNVPQLIDPALLRPGRLDVVVVMGYPDYEMRKKIALRAISRYDIKLESEDLLDEIARETRWFSAAEIDSLVRIAASRGRGTITMESLMWAKRKFSINDSERRTLQDYLRYYASKISTGLVLSYVPKESEI